MWGGRKKRERKRRRKRETRGRKGEREGGGEREAEREEREEGERGRRERVNMIYPSPDQWFRTHTHLHCCIEYLENLMLESNGGEGVVREDRHHTLVDQG